MKVRVAIEGLGELQWLAEVLCETANPESWGTTAGDPEGAIPSGIWIESQDPAKVGRILNGIERLRLGFEAEKL